MNPEVKKKWTSALRNGEYTQARNALTTDGSFCCLGVLCDLYIKENPTKAHWENNIFIFGDEDDPETVEAEADLAFRIANYLKLNGFKNLAEAEAKGWGDTRPLTDRPNGGTA